MDPIFRMAKRATTRVDPRTHQFTVVPGDAKWYDHIFIAPQISLSVFGIHIVPLQQKNRVSLCFSPSQRYPVEGQEELCELDVFPLKGNLLLCGGITACVYVCLSDTRNFAGS